MFRVLLVLAMLFFIPLMVFPIVPVFGHDGHWHPHFHDGNIHSHGVENGQPAYRSAPEQLHKRAGLDYAPFTHHHGENVEHDENVEQTPPVESDANTPPDTAPTSQDTSGNTQDTSGNTQDTTTESAEEISSPQPVGPVAAGSAPQERRPEPTPMQPLRVTEYMLRDWSKGGVIGNSNLPQWIELYNPNIEAVNLKGWTFQYATRRFRNQPYKIHTLTLAATEDGFSIPGGGVAILSTQQLHERKFSGIEATQVYNLNIENVLKRGWVLTDADDKEVQRLGRDAFSALWDPVAPPHQDGARVSHHVYLSESPSESYYYGDSGDIGSPGFYKQPAPAAPSLVRPKRVGTWADLKR